MDLNVTAVFNGCKAVEPFMREATLCFMREYPKVQLHAHYKTHHELLRQLRNKQIDIILQELANGTTRPTL